MCLVLHSESQGREGKKKKGAKIVLGPGAKEIRAIISMLLWWGIEVYFLKQKYRALLIKVSVKKQVV